MRTRTLVLTVLLGALAVYKLQPVEPVVAIGHSMEPTLQPNQVAWATRNFDEIKRGDVVVFSVEGSTVVKRVVGLPGDRIKLYFVSGEWIAANDEVSRRDYEQQEVWTRTIIVPAGSVWVLGDNIRSSEDSRSFGPVPIESIRSKLLDTTSERGLVPGIRTAKILRLHRDSIGWSA